LAGAKRPTAVAGVVGHGGGSKKERKSEKEKVDETTNEVGGTYQGSVGTGEGERVDKSKVERMAKATKADDDAVPVHIWDEASLNRRILLLDGQPVCEAGDFVDEQEVGLLTFGQSFATYGEVLGPRQARAVKAFETIRRGALRWWRRNLVKSFWQHWRREHYSDQRSWLGRVVEWDDDEGPHGKRWIWAADGHGEFREWASRNVGTKRAHWEAGCDGIQRGCRADWWEWSDGATLFYWRWPAWYRDTVVLGLPVYFREEFVPKRQHQPDERDPLIKLRQGIKLGKVTGRRYVAKTTAVADWTSFFSVPKGADDIRMVYDASRSGLNAALWVPGFPLPTTNTHLRSVEPGTWLADLDIGEMFLNFPLHASLRALCGVDLSHYGESLRDSGVKLEEWELRSFAWVRCAMGLRPSPYQAVQGALVAEEVILGDREDPNNIFRWDKVVLNLPGSASYDPTRAWVYKVRLKDGRVAADLATYVDDQRVSAPSDREGWRASRRVASINNFLGLQDAARKRRGPSQEPGAWSGSVIRTTNDEVAVLVSQEKWEKGQAYVSELRDMWAAGENQEGVRRGDRKRLETIRGFLQYLTKTYPSVTPYLKGIHLSVDGWRPDRDRDGWRKAKRSRDVRGSEVEEEWGGKEVGWVVSSSEAPKRVGLVPRFETDSEALAEFFGPPLPPVRRVRGRIVIECFYGFGDASGTGFGSTFASGRAGFRVHYRFGQWCTEISEESSNYRELRNLVDAVEQLVLEEDLKGVEIFLFTDNSTAEGAFWKGNSSSRKLFELVLRLKKLEWEFGLNLHVVHVAGKRMIAQGTDGMSRADFTEGVMAGHAMGDYVPLHLGVGERSAGLLEWVLGWLGGLETGLGEPTILPPEDWFGRGHSPGIHVWAPPPAAAEVVVEQVGRSRHKRPTNLHVVVVPRLMTGRWRRAMARQADFYFRIPVGTVLWESQMFEPVLIFVSLPFRSHRPWMLERRDSVDLLVGDLLADGVWEAGAGHVGSLLREFLLRSVPLWGLSERVV